MGRKKLRLDESELELVYNSIEEFIFKNHKLCSVTEIISSTGLPKYRCNKILKVLVSNGKISIAYCRNWRPHIYIPTYMFDDILKTQYKSSWLDKYSFSEKIEKQKQIENIKKEIYHYEMIEKLLYGTDISLENAVAYSLSYLEFKDVVHHKKKDLHDVSFKYNEKNFLLEVEGTTRQGSKEKVNQLRGWIQKAVDEGTDPDKLVGVFVVNHFIDKDPDERQDPLTKHAIDYLKLYHFNFFTTYFLFNLIKQVENNSLMKTDAQEFVIRGEKYD